MQAQGMSNCRAAGTGKWGLDAYCLLTDVTRFGPDRMNNEVGLWSVKLECLFQ